MKSTFLAKEYWKTIVQEGDTVIDATVGNGHDTLTLATLVGHLGKVIGYDIQKKSIEKAEIFLKTHGLHATLRLQSHAHFEEKEAKLIVYNLGYLPGGDKTVVTQPQTTLESLKHACNILLPGGAISLLSYVGHEEGKKECEAVTAFFQALSTDQFEVIHHVWLNRREAPQLFFCKKSEKS